MPRQTITGKAFEYACLLAFKTKCQQNGQDVYVDDTAPQIITAKNAYHSLSPEAKANYDAAASTAVKLVLPIEPEIEHGTGSIILSLNTDSRGIEGDVRDLLCVRVSENWEIGFSCKHNHAALKHPRITESGNFGADWVGHNCSQEFLDAIHSITVSLDGSTIWANIPNKYSRYYLPILNLYAREIKRLCENHNDVPQKLLGYFFGSNDFYKIISIEQSRQTKIEGFNIHGTMNRPSGKTKPLYRVSKLTMPTRILDLQIIRSTTLILAFDGGWTIKMRIHNKDEIAKPTSLAWDVQLAGMPPELYQQQRSWDE